MRAEPFYYCAVCKGQVSIRTHGGQPLLSSARRTLDIFCRKQGHPSEPVYHAGLIIGPPAGAMS